MELWLGTREQQVIFLVLEFIETETFVWFNFWIKDCSINTVARAIYITDSCIFQWELRVAEELGPWQLSFSSKFS